MTTKFLQISLFKKPLGETLISTSLMMESEIFLYNLLDKHFFFSFLMAIIPLLIIFLSFASNVVDKPHQSLFLQLLGGHQTFHSGLAPCDNGKSCHGWLNILFK